MSDSDLMKLYSSRILALAADMPRTDRLVEPSASVKRRAPLCGSTVTVDLQVVDGVVVDYGQDVKACALGQAAASVVGSSIVGSRVEQVVQARDELKAMLKANGPVPSSPFDGLEVLIPARDYKNRHDSILLALNASVEAIENSNAMA
ncbi:MAG: iron-sulfur cluster assembly scaffold protein [Paracoccaceae bacterium]|jgi:NifU-like protein involved in Fe-S cluster formation|nr:iron-sulfur cluster assembly scaffold protein [Paracoccaceae bacterium]